eukprot:15446359-Alexandrium_andersonii.AAC.1
MAIGIREAAREVVLVAAYAPHAGYETDDRQMFFDSLAEVCDRLGGPRPLLVLGDLNSRIFHTFPEEASHFG